MPRSTEAAYDLAGAYAIDTISGTMAAGLAAQATVYSCRWGDTTGKLMVVRSIALEMNSLGTGFTAGLALFEAMRATAFTASDSSGTAITPAAGNAKRRTSHADSAITDLRQSATGGLAAGTRTLDAKPFATLRASIDATVNKIFVPDAPGKPNAVLYSALNPRDIPLVFKQDEGFTIRATVPATGTWEFRVTLEWWEVNSF